MPRLLADSSCLYVYIHTSLYIIITLTMASDDILERYGGVAGQQFPRPVLPPGVGAHACHPWLRQCLLPVSYWAGCSPHVGLGLFFSNYDVPL